jgi:hypothetical protein
VWRKFDACTATARADDFSDCFNLNQTPLPFVTIQTKFDANHFIYDTSPPLPPDDD